jgi:hypothetical protein
VATAQHQAEVLGERVGLAIRDGLSELIDARDLSIMRGSTLGDVP